MASSPRSLSSSSGMGVMPAAASACASAARVRGCPPADSPPTTMLAAAAAAAVPGEPPQGGAGLGQLARIGALGRERVLEDGEGRPGGVGGAARELDCPAAPRCSAAVEVQEHAARCSRGRGPDKHAASPAGSRRCRAVSPSRGAASGRRSRRARSRPSWPGPGSASGAGSGSPTASRSWRRSGAAACASRTGATSAACAATHRPPWPPAPSGWPRRAAASRAARAGPPRDWTWLPGPGCRCWAISRSRLSLMAAHRGIYWFVPPDAGAVMGRTDRRSGEHRTSASRSKDR